MYRLYEFCSGVDIIALVSVPWQWQVSEVGAEAVKARFAELKQQFDSGAISQEQYRKGVRELKKDLSDLKDEAVVNKRAFEVAHPAIVNFGRVSSALSSVMSASVTAMNAVNIATLTLSSTNSTLAEQQQAVDKAQRDYNDAVRKYGEDSPKAKDALAEWNIEQQKLKEVTDQFNQSKINSLLTLGTSIASIGTAAASTVTKIPEFTKLAKDIASSIGLIDKSSLFTTNRVGALTGALSNIGRDTSSITSLSGALRNIETSAIAASGAVTGLSGAVGTAGTAGAAATGLTGAISSAIGPLGAVAGQLGAIAAAWGSIRPLIEQFAKGAFGTQTAEALSETPSLASRFANNPLFDTAPFKNQVDDTDKSLQKLLTTMNTDLPNAGQQALNYMNNTFTPAFTEAWASTWNIVINTTNKAMSGLVGGLQSAMNSVIASMNSTISAYNSAAAKLGQSGIPTLSHVGLSFRNIPFISAATGFSGILRSDTIVQAHKGELLNISPASSQVSNSVSTSNNISNGGSTTIIQHIHGSVLAERDLYKTNARYNKREVLRRGWRPVS